MEILSSFVVLLMVTRLQLPPLNENEYVSKTLQREFIFIQTLYFLNTAKTTLDKYGTGTTIVMLRTNM